MSHEKLRSGVYNIVNLIDGKQYIGSACNLAERRNEHFRQSKSNPHLKNAFKKYGKENFEFRVLEYVEDV
jgi:group I intron endonuclease